MSSLDRCFSPELSVLVEYLVVTVNRCMEPFSNCLYHLIKGASGYAEAEHENVALSSALAVTSVGPSKIFTTTVKGKSITFLLRSTLIYLGKVLQLVGC